MNNQCAMAVYFNEVKESAFWIPLGRHCAVSGHFNAESH